LEGEVQADAAIFADTGWEPAAVYEHLTRLRRACEEHGFPLYVVSNGNIRDTARQKDFYEAPYFLLGEDGRRGMARRQCTHQLKIVPIRRKMRELMDTLGIMVRAAAVESLIGISFDEVQRMKDSDVRYIVNRWPLIERHWTRSDCERYLAERGWSAPRSACIGCPFHSNAEWRALRDLSADEWDDAVRFEQEIQRTNAGLRGKPFLHSQRVPLPLVNLDSGTTEGFDAECEGMCGV
jgi:3'-phosphoadenosine 5'-phosphosulfate sulfotransferase (PAPS reductase)/FAD synthetase